MPPNLGGFFMVRSYYPSECHADYFDFERIEALKPAIEACGISTLSQSPMLGFHKQMDNRIIYKHSVPRFFVPEHGTMFTLALVRFPPTATKEIQYLNAKGALTYTDIAGDPVLYGNLPPREISMKDVF